MTNHNKYQCFMFGLPETGKSTFLAALWHVAKSNEIPSSMRLARRHGDQEYLNIIASNWSKCEELSRTAGEGETNVSILLKDPIDQREIELNIPDMTGETFRSQWETRSWSVTVASLIASAGGFLLCVHPEKTHETELIDDANAIFEEWATENGDENDVVSIPGRRLGSG